MIKSNFYYLYTTKHSGDTKDWLQYIVANLFIATPKDLGKKIFHIFVYNLPKTLDRFANVCYDYSAYRKAILIGGVKGLGRAERRAYNRKHKTKLTREQFDSLIALARINAGNFNFSDLQVSPDFAHADNYELVPEGCPCKLNYDAIMSRPQADKVPEFLQWVKEHKDVELHVTREGAANSLICFKEDERYV